MSISDIKIGNFLPSAKKIDVTKEKNPTIYHYIHLLSHVSGIYLRTVQSATSSEPVVGVT